MATQSTKKELRSFGLLVGGIFAVIGVWPLLVRGEEFRTWALALALLLIAPALIFPKSLGPVHKQWMKLGHVLGWINTRILLGVIFFGVVTPMGMIRRLLRKDSMGRELRSDIESYRLRRSARPASHMTKQY
jgi:Saxitoxin biosynthesis operon protein SxtJ